MSNKILIKAFNNIDTVHGICENCEEDTILVAIVSEYYRCTNCGFDVEQKVNGVIKYMKIDKETRMTFVNDGKD